MTPRSASRRQHDAGSDLQLAVDVFRGLGRPQPEPLPGGHRRQEPAGRDQQRTEEDEAHGEHLAGI